MKPCPNLPKGVRCPLCQGAWVCLHWQKRKPAIPINKEKP